MGIREVEHNDNVWGKGNWVYCNSCGGVHHKAYHTKRHIKEVNMDSDALLWAFNYVYHMDKANACMHCAPVRFSPITFRLAEALLDLWSEGEDITTNLAEVRIHMGQYAEDIGR